MRRGRAPRAPGVMDLPACEGARAARRPPGAGRGLRAGAVGAGGGRFGAWGSFRALAPAGLPTSTPGSPPAPEAAAAGPSRAPGGSRGPRSPHSRSRDWSPPLRRQRLRKEGVRLRKAECGGEIRLGNQEKGREGERRLHMTSRSQ